MNPAAVRLPRQSANWCCHVLSPPGLGRGLRAGLASLLLQSLASDADALLLVRVGRTQRAQIRGNLADLALIGAGHGHVRLLFDRDRDSYRNRKFDRVRIAEREHHVLALYFSAVTNADDIEVFLEAGRYAGDGVGNQRARKAVQRALIVRRTLRIENAVLLLEADAGRQRHIELALRALNFHFVGLDVDLHARGHRDDFVSNSRHVSCFLREPISKTVETGEQPNYQTSHIISPPMPALRAA